MADKKKGYVSFYLSTGIFYGYAIASIIFFTDYSAAMVGFLGVIANVLIEDLRMKKLKIGGQDG